MTDPVHGRLELALKVAFCGGGNKGEETTAGWFSRRELASIVEGYSDLPPFASLSSFRGADLPVVMRRVRDAVMAWLEGPGSVSRPSELHPMQVTILRSIANAVIGEAGWVDFEATLTEAEVVSLPGDRRLPLRGSDDEWTTETRSPSTVDSRRREACGVLAAEFLALRSGEPEPSPVDQLSVAVSEGDVRLRSSQPDSGPVVLIVDDEDVELLAAALEGHRLETARTVAEAFEVLESKRRVDAAVVDMMIGDRTAESGREVLRRMNELEHRRETPKVVVSLDPQLGRHESSTRRFLDEFIVFDLLHKPPDGGAPDRLRSVIREALDRPAADVVRQNIGLRRRAAQREVRSRRGGKVELLSDQIDIAADESLSKIERAVRTADVENGELWEIYDSFVATAEGIVRERGEQNH